MNPTSAHPSNEATFVILLHEMPESSQRQTHWDLMFEDGNKLATWSLASDPFDGRFPIMCTKLPPHRNAYLEYEGPVSGGRGVVRRLDRGVFRWVDRSEECVIVELEGKKFVGRFELRRESIATDDALLRANDQFESWLLNELRKSED